MEAGTVGFICTAAGHPARAEQGGRGLTVNDGEWAFCPAGEGAEHEWSRIARTSLEELARAALAAARAKLERA